MVDVKNLIKIYTSFEKSLDCLFFTLIISSYTNGLKGNTKSSYPNYLQIIHNLERNNIINNFISMVINFNYTFTLFHEIFFRNDLWILDPRNDYLLIMFPERFF